MKGFIITLVIFILVCVIGYYNKNAFDSCVEKTKKECYELGFNNCENTAKDKCEFDGKM